MGARLTGLEAPQRLTPYVSYFKRVQAEATGCPDDGPPDARPQGFLAGRAKCFSK